MKSITTVTLFCALVLLPIVGRAQEPSTAQQQGPQLRYAVKDLGTLTGGTFSQATFLNNGGVVTGLSTTANGTQHAALWIKGHEFDIGKHGLGGPNSGAFGINSWSQVVGQAESSDTDPNHENFCAYGTGLKCLPFLWELGIMRALPTLGGNKARLGRLIIAGKSRGWQRIAPWTRNAHPHPPSTAPDLRFSISKQ